MNFFTRWMVGDAIQELKLRSEPTKAKASMPKAPVLDVSAQSLTRYARASELVYACIEKKAQAACDAELVVQKKVGDKWENITDHPALAVLNKPNPFDDGESFMRSWIASENVTDIFYAEIVRSGAGLPVALYPLLPQNVSPQYKSVGGRWVLDYYSYQIDGVEVRFAPEELLIRRRHSLGSVFGGVSAMQVALGSVDADTALTEYVRAFFNNGGQPSGVLNIEGRALKDEEIEAIQQKWTARFGRRGRQRGGVAVLDKTKASYEAVGSKLTELESEGLTSINEARVCMGFGVPPILIGAYVGLVNVNQKASFKGAMEEFWQGTMSPELKSIRNFLTWNFLPEFENIEDIKKGRIRFNWDISQVDALQEDLDSIYKRMGAAVKDGVITPNEARSKLGFEPLENGDDLRPAQSPAFGQGQDNSDGDGKTEPKQLSTGDIEKKTFDFEGLILSRQPTEVEKKIDLKSLNKDFETNRQMAARVLLRLRDDLLKQAYTQVETVEDDKLHTIILTPPNDAAKNLKKALRKAYGDGRAQIARELAAQKNQTNFEIKEKSDYDGDENLSDITISRVINEIQARFSSELAALRVLGYTGKELIEKLKDKFKNISDKFFEQIAGRAAQKATNDGRTDEIEDRADEIECVEYSAIFDKNLCEYCETADGETASEPADLTPVPNPDCLGGDACRCFHIAVRV